MLSQKCILVALCCLLMTMEAEGWTDLIIGAGQAAVDIAPTLADALTFSSDWLDATAAAAALHDAALGLTALAGY